VVQIELPGLLLYVLSGHTVHGTVVLKPSSPA
jgi:hypothetical protein